MMKDGRLIMGALLGGGLCGLFACATGADAGGQGSGGSGVAVGGGGSSGGGTGGGGIAGAPGAAGRPGPSPANVDDGSLFQDAGSISSTLADAGGPETAPDVGATTSRDAAGSAIPGDGNSATGKIGGLGLTAVFTQKGVDVTVVITATRCAPGMHTFTIHEGFACDDPTKGPVWGGGKRGGGIPSLMCDGTQHGSLTYTRTGSDPSTNWTVADHNQATDLTLHPLMADTQCGTFF